MRSWRLLPQSRRISASFKSTAVDEGGVFRDEVRASFLRPMNEREGRKSRKATVASSVLARTGVFTWSIRGGQRQETRKRQGQRGRPICPHCRWRTNAPSDLFLDCDFRCAPALAQDAPSNPTGTGTEARLVERR
jgi:hypothetical protein